MGIKEWAESIGFSGSGLSTPFRLVIPNKTVDRISDIGALIGVKSRVHVISTALASLEELAKCTSDGGAVILRDSQGNERELELS